VQALDAVDVLERVLDRVGERVRPCRSWPKMRTTKASVVPASTSSMRSFR
jgi:hypothetical protein